MKIILSVFALFYRLTPNYLIISNIYFLHRQVSQMLNTYFFPLQNRRFEAIP